MPKPTTSKELFKEILFIFIRLFKDLIKAFLIISFSSSILLNSIVIYLPFFFLIKFSLLTITSVIVILFIYLILLTIPSFFSDKSTASIIKSLLISYLSIISPILLLTKNKLVKLKH